MALDYQPSRGQTDPAMLEALRRRLGLVQDPQPMPGRVQPLPPALPVTPINAPLVEPGNNMPGRAPASQVDVTKFDFGDPPPPQGPGRASRSVPRVAGESDVDYERRKRHVETPTTDPETQGWHDLVREYGYERASEINMQQLRQSTAGDALKNQPPAIQSMERVSAEMPKPSYATASIGDDGSVRGATYHDKAPALPEFQTRAVEPMDSIVEPPLVDQVAAQANGPVKVGPMRPVKRKEGETDEAYNARVRREYRNALREESPYSKVTRTDGGIDVAPPVKPHGFKGRGGSALALGSRMLANIDPRNGLPGAAGAGLAGILTGIFAPGVQSKFARMDQLGAAEGEVQKDEAQRARDDQAKMREVQLEEAQSLPGRRQDAATEAQKDNLRLIWANLDTFDPKGNPEHKQLQDDAAKVGVFLPSKQPKPTRSTSRNGLLSHTKTVADTDGNKYYVDEDTGEPIPDPSDPTGRTPLYADRAQPKPVTPDLTGNYSQRVSELEEQIAADEKEMRVHSTNVTSKDRWWEREAKRRMEEAQAKDKAGDTIAGKRSLKDWTDIVRTEDPDYNASDSKYDYSVRTRDEINDRIKENRAELNRIRGELRTQREKPRMPGRRAGAPAGGAYKGQTIPLTSVQAWATAHQMSVDQARTLFEREGATVQ